jgi:hypothetical protein
MRFLTKMSVMLVGFLCLLGTMSAQNGTITFSGFTPVGGSR